MESSHYVKSGDGTTTSAFSNGPQAFTFEPGLSKGPRAKSTARGMFTRAKNAAKRKSVGPGQWTSQHDSAAKNTDDVHTTQPPSASTQAPSQPQPSSNFAAPPSTFGGSMFNTFASSGTFPATGPSSIPAPGLPTGSNFFAATNSSFPQPSERTFFSNSQPVKQDLNFHAPNVDQTFRQDPFAAGLPARWFTDSAKEYSANGVQESANVESGAGTFATDSGANNNSAFNIGSVPKSRRSAGSSAMKSRSRMRTATPHKDVHGTGAAYPEATNSSHETKSFQANPPQFPFHPPTMAGGVTNPAEPSKTSHDTQSSQADPPRFSFRPPQAAPSATNTNNVAFSGSMPIPNFMAPPAAVSSEDREGKYVTNDSGGKYIKGFCSGQSSVEEKIAGLKIGSDGREPFDHESTSFSSGSNAAAAAPFSVDTSGEKTATPAFSIGKGASGKTTGKESTPAPRSRRNTKSRVHRAQTSSTQRNASSAPFSPFSPMSVDETTSTAQESSTIPGQSFEAPETPVDNSGTKSFTPNQRGHFGFFSPDEGPGASASKESSKPADGSSATAASTSNPNPTGHFGFFSPDGFQGSAKPDVASQSTTRAKSSNATKSAAGRASESAEGHPKGLNVGSPVPEPEDSGFSVGSTKMKRRQRIRRNAKNGSAVKSQATPVRDGKENVPTQTTQEKSGTKSNEKFYESYNLCTQHANLRDTWAESECGSCRSYTVTRLSAPHNCFQCSVELNRCMIRGCVETAKVLDFKSTSFSTLWQKLQEEAKTLYSKEDYYASSQFYTLAIRLYRNLNKKDEPKMLNNRAACHMMCGDMEAAIADCTQAMASDKNYHKAYLRAGRASLMLGKTRDCTEYLGTACMLCAVGSADYKLATEHLEAAAKLDTLMKECSTSFVLHRFHECLKLTKSAREIAPFNHKLVEWTVDSYICRREWKEILTFSETLLKDKVLRCTRQYLHDTQKGTSSLKTHSEKAVALGSKFGVSYAKALRYSNQRQEAVDAVAAVARKFGQDSAQRLLQNWQEIDTQKDQGNKLFQEALYRLAAQAYTRALQLDSDDIKYHAVLLCNRAAAYMGLNDFRKAASDCSEALLSDSSYSKAMLRRARCYVSLQQYSRAITDFHGYFALNPDEAKGRLWAECKEAQKLFDDQIRSEYETKRNKSRGNRQHQNSENHNSNSNGNWRSKSQGNNWKEEFRQSYSYQQKTNSNSHHRKSYSVPVVEKEKTHYEVLGVCKTATVAEIKKAYRALALKHHPDKCKDDGAETIFKDIANAYHVLNDTEQRREYDRTLLYGW